MNTQIPIFRQINDHHEAVGATVRTRNPLVHVLRLETISDDVRPDMPPYRNDFYDIIYGRNVTDLDYTINDNRFRASPNFLAFSAPGQVHHWQKRSAWAGFVFCFQRAFLPDEMAATLLQRYPFFAISEANFLAISAEEAAPVELAFEQALAEQDRTDHHALHLVRAQLQVLLLLARRLYENHRPAAVRSPANDGLAARFQALVNEQFLTLHQVTQYAEQLNVTPNHLGQALMLATGRTAKSVIQERLLLEARYLLAYTRQPIATIADQLQFSVPTHFGQFFRQHTGLTPSQYRHQSQAPDSM
jgi:AraC family transcriptional regulator, transcriptional activator of pobA